VDQKDSLTLQGKKGASLLPEVEMVVGRGGSCSCRQAEGRGRTLPYPRTGEGKSHGRRSLLWAPEGAKGGSPFLHAKLKKNLGWNNPVFVIRKLSLHTARPKKWGKRVSSNQRERRRAGGRTLEKEVAVRVRGKGGMHAFLGEKRLGNSRTIYAMNRKVSARGGRGGGGSAKTSVDGIQGRSRGQKQPSACYWGKKRSL